jgi:hypothetical protein
VGVNFILLFDSSGESGQALVEYAGGFSGNRKFELEIPGGPPSLPGWERWRKIMTPMPQRSLLRSRKGQSLVEFALSVTLLVTLVFGMAEFGRAWMTKSIVTGAARDAARMYAAQDNITAADARADNVLMSGSLDLGRRLPYLRSNLGGTVSYTVTYRFPMFTRLFPILDNILLSSTTTMRREY